MIPTFQLDTISISKIEIGERFRKDYGSLEQLKYSINKHGLITPIAVVLTSSLETSTKSEKPYTLLAGGRRLEATTQLGWDSIEAKIFDQPLTELEYRSIELAENLERKSMSYMEEISLKKQINDLQIQIHGPKYGKTPDAPGWSQADTAELLGESPANLSRDLKLAVAIEKFPEAGLDKCKTKSDALKMLNSLVTKSPPMKVASEISTPEPPKPSNVGEKYFKRLHDAYIIGDYRKTLGQMPNSSIDFIEIDLPTKEELKNSPLNLFKLLSECYRVLRDNSWMICWDSTEAEYVDLLTALRRAKFKVNPIPNIWLKPLSSTPHPEINLVSCYESFFYCSKGNPKLTREGRANVFEFPPVPKSKKIYPNQRPLPLMLEIFSTFCKPNSSAYIPFLGSGVSLLAAHSCKMSALGNDLEKDYKISYTTTLKDYLENLNASHFIF